VFVITGDQKIKELSSNGRSDNDIKEAINEAIKNPRSSSQKITTNGWGTRRHARGGQ